MFTATTKLSAEGAAARQRFAQLGEDYKKCLKDLQKVQKEYDDKNSKVKQLEVEVSHLTDQLAAREKKISTLTKDNCELSSYRGSVNSINSVELNNEM